MTVYIVSYLGADCGHMEAFSNKAAAVKRHNEIKRDESTEHMFDMTIEEFEISAKGVLAAIEFGAETVMK